MPIDSKECFAALTEDGQLWEIYQAASTGGGTGITSINGDTTAAQLISGTAPITASTAAGTTTISTSMNTARLLGRTTAGVGVAEEISVGTGLSLAGGTLTNTIPAGVTSVTATAPLTSSGGATPDISTSIATNRIVGRSTAGTGVMEQLTPVGITVSGGNITGIGGTVGLVDNVVPRADGTGGYTVQDSGLIVEDAIVSFTGITGDAGTDVITATGSAFANGQPVRFTALTGGSGLNTTTNYFVREVSGATFKVETSIGGGAINFTTNITAGTLLTGHSVSTNVTLSENTTATNSDLVLTPKGTGALIAQKPNGAASGGNARGANAVDWQMSRLSAIEVASGILAVIGGGERNRASGNYSTISGGWVNAATGSFSVISGGRENVSTNDFSTVAGGFTINASGNSSSVGGGNTNTASGNNTSIAGGNTNTASANGSSICGGLNTVADRFSMQAHAAGRFAANGDAQRARFVLRNSTANNTPTELFLDGSSTRLTIPVNKAMGFTIQVIGSIQGMAENAYFVRKGMIVNDNATTTLVGSVESVGTDQKSAGATATDVTVTASDANDALIITVTGIASQNWRWVASVDAVEVQYA